MTSFLNYQFGYVIILHVWIIGCLNLVNSKKNVDNAAAYNFRIDHGDLHIENNDDVWALCNLTNLPPDTLTKLEEANSIRFGDEDITTVPEKILQNLGELMNLEYIHFDDTKLTKLPEKLFSNLTSVRAIFLFSNSKLQTLPPFLFKGLIKLTEIYLNHNGFTTFSRQQFGNLKNLRRIEIMYNPLRELSTDLFKGSTNLQIIMINNCNLTSVPNGLFRGLIYLETVSLSHNKLTELPEDFFYGLQNLEAISFHKNQLISLPERIFKNLTKLRCLFLEDNKLKQLPDNLFIGLKLKMIFIDHNQLRSSSNIVFENQNVITKLDLKNDDIRVFPLTALRILPSDSQIINIQDSPKIDSDTEDISTESNDSKF